MYSKVLVVLALAAAAQSRDLFEGANKTEARSIYDEHLQASPAIWQQTKDVFVNTTENEIISLINITDLRPEKDGEIQLVSGGVGHNNVGITLKSPTVLRGYDFLVQVYSAVDEHHGASEQTDTAPRGVPGEATGKPEPPKVPREVTVQSTEKTHLPTESKMSTEGATVTYPTQSDVTITLPTNSPAPAAKSKPKDLAMPEPAETNTSTETPADVPVENENIPKLQPFISFHPRATQEPH